ncbi:MAG: carboxypeptidase regulatory-like domain-containing protein, partial [Muribaculaceae bacterium]|nr:carboxypeptidase regulatory-like domain-containing protein [Muribaculaceae bacterium]
MRIKLTLLTLLCIAMTALADTGVKGIVVDSRTGKPVADANVLLRERAIFVVTGSDGVFTISNTSPGEDVIDIIASGYEDASQDVVLKENIVLNIG